MKILFSQSLWLSIACVCVCSCNLWSGYDEEIPFGTSPNNGANNGANNGINNGVNNGVDPCSPSGGEISPVDGEATITGEICAEGTALYSLTLDAGTHLEVELTHVSEGLVWIDLIDEFDEKVAIPVFSDGTVTLSELITRSGIYELRAGGEAREAFELHLLTTPIPGEVRWISPEGDDDGNGSVDQPWQTWPKALESVSPGDLLVARDGSWTDRSSCDGLPGPCLSDTVLPEADCEMAVASGEPGAPITVAAERERRSFLAGRGVASAFKIVRCAHWALDGLAGESADTTSGASGGHVFEVRDSSNSNLRRLVARRANRDRNTYVINVVESQDVEIVESEVYDFHKNGFMIASSNDVRLLRSYANSRRTGDGAYSTTCSAAGDNGISLWNSGRITIANFISEQNCIGVNLSPRGADIPDNGDRNLIWGSAALNHDIMGFSLGANCDGAASCDENLVPSDNRLEHVVSINAAIGVRVYGGTGNVIANSSSFGTSNAGFYFKPGNGNEGGDWDATLRNSSSSGSESVPVRIDDFDLSVAAVNSSRHPDSDPDLEGSDVRTLDADFRNCRVFVPDWSPLKNAGEGGESIGAEMRWRHDGTRPLEERLWDPRDGRFACGSVVEGFNDNPTMSCSEVHERLAVGHAGCPLP